MRAVPVLPRALSLPTLVAVAVGATAVIGVAVVAPAPASAASAAPNASNTGVPSGTKLKRVDGDVVLDQAGKTYRGLDIHGRVRVAAPNITLVDSIVRGNAKDGEGAIIDCNHPGLNHKGFVLRDSSIIPTTPSFWDDAGIMGHDYTVVRAEITGTVDAVRIVGGNVTVQQSWLHDTHFWNTPNPTNRATHNDGVQVESGSNIVITGNTISGNRNAALMVAQDMGAVSGVRFTGNWSSGGACTVNLSPTPRTTLAGAVTVMSNRFRHDTSVANCGIAVDHRIVLNHPGNVWADTGGAVHVVVGR